MIIKKPGFEYNGKPSNNTLDNTLNLIKKAEKGKVDNGMPSPLYTIRSTNWYHALPYGFRRYTKDLTVYSIYLPISPENITITTHYATNVITTLYGTVEQHSEQRYFDIIISGTTGMAPLYNGEEIFGDVTRHSRASFHATDANWGNRSAGGFFANTLGRYNAIANRAQDLISPVPNETGIRPENSGYMAFHRLYRFFQEYKNDAAGVDSPKKREKGAYPLMFLNYKDNNEYQCSIQRFVLKRSANEPMLYRYEILLRAYNIRTLELEDVRPWKTVKQRMAELGLNGISGTSLLGDIKKTVGGAKDILAAASGGLGGVGG